MHISVFGTGYVGLVSGACLAEVGHRVICIDVDEAKISALRSGRIPIFEPGLEELVLRNVHEGRLDFSLDLAMAIEKSDLIFIAVGTPAGEDGSADLRYVLDVAKSIGLCMNGPKTVVNKSTVPVGTAEKVKAVIAAELSKRGVSHEFDVCSNPEFLKEGTAIDDFTHGSRIVIGVESDRAEAVLREVYAPHSRNYDKIIVMDVRSAELTKYAANAMLAAKISFMNEIANLAEKLGADVEAVRHGIGSDPRIGYQFIYPGCGYGGSCFPKDVQALTRTALEAGVTPTMLHAIESVNHSQKQILFNRLNDIFDGNLAGRIIAIWGLAFKPGTDDIRDAPSRALMEALWEAGARVRVYDPEAMDGIRNAYLDRTDIEFAQRQEDAVVGADALVICTEWKQFRVIDFDWLKASLKHPVVVDGRNLYDPIAIKSHGLRYFGIGRGESQDLHRLSKPVVGEFEPA